MTQNTKEIQIIRYEEPWAKGIAKMWNMSREDWGGDSRVETEESVKKKEADSDNLELFLAVEGEEVAGYCGLSEYKEDSGALYIPLLNVRPDYQGKKIGKQLVLQAVEKTINLGWPRLDLFTWAGNTKAVPLYKRTGFFWEDRDDTTHLMNFIPLVLNTPLLRGYFQEIDWYKDSERMIEQKPDGIKENGFTFYEYAWKNGTTNVRVRIEKTGRRISLVETDDFILELKLDQHELIEEEKQSFTIHFQNKTDKPVHFLAEGTGDGRAMYRFSDEAVVDKEVKWTSEVQVNRGEEPSVWKTHPTIEAKVWINGLECSLGLGIFPMPPAAVKVDIGGEWLARPGSEIELELEVCSHLEEPADFTISFPEDEMVSLKKANHVVRLDGKERAKVHVPLMLNRHGLYQPNLQVAVKKMDGTGIDFHQHIHVAFKAPGMKFGGESLEYWHIFNGRGHVSIRKRDLLLKVGAYFGKEPFAVFVPMLGAPFTNEFAKAKPESVIWEEQADGILLKMTLASTERKGICLTQHIHLYGDGLADMWCELENRGDERHDRLAVSYSLYHELQTPLFPVKEGVAHFDMGRSIDFGDVRPEIINGNWYFSENEPEPYGITWSETFKASPAGWKFHLKEEAGSLEPGEIKTGGKVTVSFGAFKSWQDFSEYASPGAHRELLQPLPELSLSASSAGGSPTLKLETFRNSYLDGKLTVRVNETPLPDVSLTHESAATAVQMKLDSDNLQPVNLIEAIYDNPSFDISAREILLCPGEGTVNIRKTLRENHEVFEAGNGCLEIMAAPAFYPGVFSIQFDGAEWLDHCFPETTVKSYWNPWAGGMKTVPSRLTSYSLKKEVHSAGFAEATDSEGNVWKGLSIKTELKEHKEWKGTAFIQYYFMLPGVPVVAAFAKMVSDGGKRLKDVSWETDLFIGGVPRTSLWAVPNRGTQANVYRFGREELNFKWQAGSYIAASGKEEKVYYVPNIYEKYTEVYTNKEAAQLIQSQKSIPSSHGRLTAANFLLFDKRPISREWLDGLRKIRFGEIRSRDENH